MTKPATVTREHQLAAVKIVTFMDRGEAEHRGWAWLGDKVIATVDRVAQALADAEERGRSLERADVLQRLDNELADDEHGESWQLLERDDFQYLRTSIERGDHEGGAARAKETA